MSPTEVQLNDGKFIQLKSTEITVVNRTTIAGVTQETVQAIKLSEILGLDTAVHDISTELTRLDEDQY